MSARRYYKEDHLKVKALRKDGHNLRNIAAILEIPIAACSMLARHGDNLPMANLVHFKVEDLMELAGQKKEQYFQHDPYYKF